MRVSQLVLFALIVFARAAAADTLPKPTATDPAPRFAPLRDEIKNYPPVDSGLYGSHPDIGVQGWLDNDTVVFMGFRSEGERQTQYPQQMTANLYAWNTRTKQTTIYTEQAMNACAFDGYVRYVEIDSAGGYAVYAGRPPAFVKLAYYKNEKEYWENSRYNQYSCKEWDKSLPTRGTRPLHERHGFARIDELKLGGQWEFHDTASGSVIEAPHRGSRTPALVYSPWKECYGYHSMGFPSPENPILFWELCPGRGVTTTPIPYGGVDSSAIFYQRAMVGFVASSANSRNRAYGLYLIDGRGPAKLFTGRALHFSISPDGCKVAFGEIQHEILISRPRIQAISLCKKG